jgi:hypothetical protein
MIKPASARTLLISAIAIGAVACTPLDEDPPVVLGPPVTMTPLDKATIDRMIDERLAERGIALVPMSAPLPARSPSGDRGFDPCAPGRANDSRIAPVCARVSVWLGTPPDPRSSCSRVIQACKSSGYYQGGFGSGKGLYFDCVTPLLLGDVVPDVAIDPAVPAACMVEPDGAASSGRSPRWLPWTGNPSDPCDPLMRACNAAGYYAGGVVEGKGIFSNCREPLLRGRPVADVEVNDRMVAACQRGARRQPARL